MKLLCTWAGIVLGSAVAVPMHHSLGLTSLGVVLVTGAAGIFGHAVGRIVKAQEAQAEALQQAANAALLPYGLATGAIELGDLVDARVPDAPPEDLR